MYCRMIHIFTWNCHLSPDLYYGQWITQHLFYLWTAINTFFLSMFCIDPAKVSAYFNISWIWLLKWLSIENPKKVVCFKKYICWTTNKTQLKKKETPPVSLLTATYPCKIKVSGSKQQNVVNFSTLIKFYY